MCYYDLEEGEPPIFTNPKKDRVIKEGDEVVVQVSREGIKSKLPSVTGNLNFTGRYLVLTSQRKQLAFPQNLQKKKKPGFGPPFRNMYPVRKGSLSGLTPGRLLLKN